jgi:hypothetical protein
LADGLALLGGRKLGPQMLLPLTHLLSFQICVADLHKPNLATGRTVELLTRYSSCRPCLQPK